MQNKYNEFLDKFRNILNSSSKILITSHMNPDNDSVASVLTMRYILETYYDIQKDNIDIIYSGKFENDWHFLEGSQDIKAINDIKEIVDYYDTFIFLDGREYLRFSKDPDNLKKSMQNKSVIVIDHHEFNPDFEILTNLKVTDTSNISCADLIYEIFLSDKGRLDLNIAEIVMSGILSDSGSFNFISQNTLKSLDNVRNLMINSDVNIQELNQKMSGFSYNRYKYLAQYINNSKIIEIKNKKYLYSYIDEVPGNSDELNNLNESGSLWIQMFQGKIEEIDTAIVTKYRLENNGISVSLRSKKNAINVSDLMQKMQIGGGHPKASGGIFKFDKYPNIIPSVAMNTILQFIIDNDIETNEN